MVGRTLAHYELIDTIGRGGMGVVYRARDTKLGRLVALKFLPEDRASDKRLIARFRREARAASALNHPNICTIFDIDEVEGNTFIVMELLKGVSLKEFINGKPLPTDIALTIVIEIAHALAASHAGGIVHRDIKPANVFVCANNHIKVLDFGLALQTEPAGPPDELGRTIDANELTVSGTAIGTIAYMSPEQARCEEVDGRADLFSIGAVLYEMITGMPAFASGSIALTFQAILSGRPAPCSRLNPQVSPELEAIVFRLIEKDRERRYQSVGDLLKDLEQLRGEMSGVLAVPFPRRTKWPLALVASVLILSVVLAWFLPRVLQKESVPEHLTFAHITNQPGAELFPNFSPDGRTLAYASPAAGNWDIYVQRVGGQNATNLTRDSSADDTQPAFSPDGESIAFRSQRDGGGIYVMGATGESAKRVSDFGFNPAWSPDGKQIVFAEEGVDDIPQYRYKTSGLWTVSVTTGEKKKFFAGDAVQPQWSPHGYRIVYWARNGGQRDLWTVRPDGTNPVQLTNDAPLDWSPTWSRDGRAVYFSSDRGGGTDLWRIGIDERNGSGAAIPEALTSGGTAQRLHPSISADGRRIAYVEETQSENIFQVPFDPAAGKITGAPRPVTAGGRIATSPDLSPDGKHIVFQSLGKKMEIYITGVDATGERKLTDDDYQYRIPHWSPDGKKIAFYSNRTGTFQIWTINADGSDLRQITNDRGDNVLRAVWAPDGNHLAGRHVDGTTFIVSLLQGEVIRSIPAPPGDNELFDVWSWSPDGNWLAGHRTSRTTGRNEGLAAFSIRSGKFQNLTNSGSFPVWLKDNRQLLFNNLGKISLVDRDSGETRDLLSVKPNTVASLGQPSSDNRTIVFSAEQKEADIWMISLDAAVLTHTSVSP